VYQFLQVLRSFGLDPVKFARSARMVPRLLRDARAYKSLGSPASLTLKYASLYPCLGDFQATAGDFCGHYFYQDLWAAKCIYSNRPTRHVDVGSRIDGFVAHLLTFMPVTVIDIRPLSTLIEGLTFVQDDATHLSNVADRSLESLSSLHAIEHFGLGRYGDPVDPKACFIAMDSMARVLAPRGRLYIGVPIGRQNLAFNAHRVFAPDTILTQFSSLTLRSFSAVDDANRFHPNAEPSEFASCQYACGLFEFQGKDS